MRKNRKLEIKERLRDARKWLRNAMTCRTLGLMGMHATALGMARAQLMVARDHMAQAPASTRRRWRTSR